MSEFLAAILAFPTVLFTIPLGVVIAYWLFVLLGALDINLLGDAGLDGHGHADLDLAGHGHAEAHLEGHGHPGDHHADVDAEHVGGFAGLIQALGLGGVPVTMTISILILAAWSFCLVTVETFRSSGWIVYLAAPTALVIAVPLTSLLIRPLRRFFVTPAAPQHRDLIGRICTITTLRVSERYGQAEVEDGAAGLIVQVRSTDPDRLNKGDRALIFDYKDEVFYVEPMNQALQKDLDNLVS